MQHQITFMYWGVNRFWIEYVIYGLFWAVLMFIPLFSGVFGGYSSAFTLDTACRYWLFLSPAFLLFVLNNNILMPYLLYRKKRRHYLLLLICLIALFYLLFQIFYDNGNVGIRHNFYWEKPLFGNNMVKRPSKPPYLPLHKVRAQMEGTRKKAVNMLLERQSSATYEIKPHRMYRNRGIMDLVLFNPMSVQLLLTAFVLTFNVCVRLFFNNVRNEDRQKDLEREKLWSELEFLRYQINPHFFMNTLNNIHALIDIDKIKAQTAVVELSMMMRYVLYESSTSFISLDKELKFLASFLSLMRLRYTDILRIDSSFPKATGGAVVPPLLLISFLENAFKHGVTYNRESAVEVKIEVDDENLTFFCRNTCYGKIHNKNTEESGIGINNARKRLGLLYGDKYTLKIKKEDNYYNVSLKIPAYNDKVYLS